MSQGSDFEYLRDDSSNEPMPMKKGNKSIVHQPSVMIQAQEADSFEYAMSWRRAF